MSWLIAVDPGIDASGVACFDLSRAARPAQPWRPGESFAECLARLGPTSVLRTRPADGTVERLRQLGLAFHTVTELPDGLDAIVIEQPAAAGAYRARQGRQRTKGLINAAALAKLHLAIGVLVDAALCHSERTEAGRVELVPASRLAKELRHNMVRAQLPPDHILHGQRRPSPDLLDAVYLGAAWLSDPQRRIERALEQAERRALVNRP